MGSIVLNSVSTFLLDRALQKRKGHECQSLHTLDKGFLFLFDHLVYEGLQSDQKYILYVKSFLSVDSLVGPYAEFLHC